MKTHLACVRRAVRQPYAGEPVVRHDQPGDLAGHHRTPAAASLRRSSSESSDSATVCRKSVTSVDHWDTSAPGARAIGAVASTPKAWSRTSQPWQYGQCSTSRPQRSAQARRRPAARRSRPVGDDAGAGPWTAGRSPGSRRSRRRGGVDHPVPDQLHAVPRDLLAADRPGTRRAACRPGSDSPACARRARCGARPRRPPACGAGPGPGPARRSGRPRRRRPRSLRMSRRMSRSCRHGRSRRARD